MPSQFMIPASSGVGLSTGVETNILSQLLPPGTYLVCGQLDFDLVAATLTKLKIGMSLVSATLPNQAGGSGMGPDAVSNTPLAFSLLSETISQQCGPTILTLTAPQTVYLVAKANFSLGSVTAYGSLNVLAIVGAGHNLVVS